jgi:predicted NBD/HSP70 family sugar kinase
MSSFVPSNLKEKNRATVYALLKSARESSKADIARESGISAPTVNKIVDYLEGLGIVGAGGERPLALRGVDEASALGRPPQRISFNPSAAFALGAEYDGVHLSVGVVDLAGGLRSLVKTAAPPDLGHLVSERLEPSIDEALNEAAQGRALGRSSIVGLGLGIPGIKDPDGSTLRFAPFVGLGEPFDYGPLFGELESRLGFPILLENDANAAALGEFSARGLGEGDDLLFAVLGRGLGAGLILDGKLRTGPRSFAGEIGYLAFDPDWEASPDRPGWLETETDLPAFWAEADGPEGPSAAALERVAARVAMGLANLCIALDLERVVIGRANSEAFGPRLLDLIEARLKRLSVLDVACEVPISPEPGVAGAASLALEGWLKSAFAG